MSPEPAALKNFVIQNSQIVNEKPRIILQRSQTNETIKFTIGDSFKRVNLPHLSLLRDIKDFQVTAYIVSMMQRDKKFSVWDLLYMCPIVTTYKLIRFY